MNEKEIQDCVPCKKIKLSPETSNSGQKGNSEAGNYWLGPIIRKKRPHVTQCLAREKSTDVCYLMKILVLNENDTTSSKCPFVTRTNFHNELSALNILKKNPGVIQLYDFFKDYVYEEEKKIKLKRVCMVLECLIQHGYHNADLLPLNHYLKKNKISELEALYIFYNILLVLESLHDKNIVHKDLKLSNIILNRKTFKVKLIDFYCAEFITSEYGNKSPCRNLLCSSTNISFSQTVTSKTCDLCSAGVILYSMLNGCLPFPNGTTYGSLLSSSRSLRVLYLKFMGNDCISDGTKELLRDILWIPQKKLKAGDVLDIVSNLLAINYSSQNLGIYNDREISDQVVPESPEYECKDQQECSSPTQEKPCLVLEISDLETDEKNVKHKSQKILKLSIVTDSEPQLHGSPSVTKPIQQNIFLNTREIKSATLRFGGTSLNNINSLSVNYYKKNSCRP